MFDPWIVGRGAISDGRYVVHTEPPRFFVEIIEQGGGAWKTGALLWIDDPGSEDARRWTIDAANAYFAVRDRQDKPTP